MSMPKLLIAIGLVIVAIGLAWMVAERFGLGRLPGDIVVERENFRLYIPITTSILISVIVSLVLWFLSR
jgi:hypothetical protein